MLVLCLLHIVFTFINGINAYEVIYAINAGGIAHTDTNKIFYNADPNRIGIGSDYGKQLLMINRIPQVDEILYQTERYHTSTFGYDIPIQGDGEYVLVLKFCEVYFTAPNLKVFDVMLNGEHTVVADLDIFSQVGKGVAHDEYVYFTVSRDHRSRDRLFWKEEESEIRGGHIRVEFIKGARDNPKINAIVLIKGDVHNIPMLSPLQNEQQEPQYIEPEVQEEKTTTKARPVSGPKQDDPYLLQDTSFMLPVFIAIGAFIPVLFCLCKL